MTAPVPRAVADAWQAALSAEYRSVFGYSLLGPHLVAARKSTAYAAQTAHADLRDATSAAMLAARVTPVPPAADYPLGMIDNSAAATRLAATLEDECAAAWRYLFGVASGAPTDDAASARKLRRAAQRSLTASAVRAARWRLLDDPGSATTPFPGI